jgi:protein Mpv17
MASYGGLFNGVVGHAWYIALDKGMKRVAVPGTVGFVGGKVLADTVIFGPFHVAAFFTIITLVEGGTLKDVKKKIDTDLVPALAAEVAIWPVIQAVNFWKVPVEYQLLVVNGFTVIDAAFMSWVQHNAFREKIEAYLKKKKILAGTARPPS